MKLTVSDERVIVRGIRPEEGLWGPYQFPHPYRLKDRIAVAVHVTEDDIKSFGNPNRWFESFDNGETWQETDPSIAAECGLCLPNGDRIYFPQENGISVADHVFHGWNERTPGSDPKERAEEGHLPIPDGMTAWMDGTRIWAYDADRLPLGLANKSWKMMRIPAGKTEVLEENVPIDWPKLTRVVFQGPGYDFIMKPIFPRGDPKIGPDGAIWMTAYSGEGHIDPSNGQYTPYYSAELFRSTDNGHSFYQHAHMEYPADGKAYPYQSGGFSDSDIAFMDDGSMLWFMRSCWFASTGYEWAPMYVSRSEDGGRTWSKPEVFSWTGILPRVVRLADGISLICYARPGMFIRASEDPSGKEWGPEIELMTPGDRSDLANVKADPVKFHDWDGACNNPELLVIDAHSALIFYVDFYYPDEEGTARKTVLCKKITVEK